ncbi:phosphoribosylamine--glycine ligase N-terminal domain-containing protein [Burkholderia gladioli]
MKLLVVGSGGREHALAWKLAQSPRVQTVYVAPGNGGTAQDARLKNIELSSLDDLADFAENEQVAFTLSARKRRWRPASSTTSASAA